MSTAEENDKRVDLRGAMCLLPSVFLVFLVTGAWPGVANAAIDEEEEPSPCCGGCCCCGGGCCGGVEKRDDGRVDDDGGPDEEEEEEEEEAEKGRGRLRSIGSAGEVELVASGVSISATRAAGMPGALDDDDTGVEALLASAGSVARCSGGGAAAAGPAKKTAASMSSPNAHRAS